MAQHGYLLHIWDTPLAKLLYPDSTEPSIQVQGEDASTLYRPMKQRWYAMTCSAPTAVLTMRCSVSLVIMAIGSEVTP